MQSDRNRITIQGTVSETPMLERTHSGAYFVRFRIYSQRYYKGPTGEERRESILLPVELWGVKAKTAVKKLHQIHKFQRVRVTGYMSEFKKTHSIFIAGTSFKIVDPLGRTKKVFFFLRNTFRKLRPRRRRRFNPQRNTRRRAYRK